MRCESAQRSLSESMDGAGAPASDVEAHAQGCSRCSDFRRGAWRVRELVRFEIPHPVPDLAPEIIARVAEERGVVPHRRHRSVSWLRPGSKAPWREAVAALVAGLVAGVALTGGGLVPVTRNRDAALAAGIPANLLRAAAQLRGYSATFSITELNWTRAVPSRRFTAEVAFRAPEGFAVRVRDLTRYPAGNWPRNNMSLRTDGRTWRASGPDPCPRAALPLCPPARRVSRTVRDRAPFDSQSPMPTDVIIPMTVLAASDRVDVAGAGRIGGRKAVAVRLSYQDAVPLFQYLRFSGSWRPFFPHDQVVVWLDRSTWFPLRYEVFAAPGPERALWAAQAGLPPERPATPIFTAAARSVVTSPPTAGPSVGRPAGQALSEGFVDLPPDRVSGHRGALRPRYTAGLSLWRHGYFTRGATRPYRQSVLAYSRGLAWLTVTRATRWRQHSLFGVGEFAEPVKLASGGVAYYDPATATQPRRVALHTSRGEFLIASYLPRRTLLAVAASLPVTGRRQPASWRIRRCCGRVVELGLQPEEAVRRAPFPVVMPAYLPPGYRAVAAQLLESPHTRGLTVAFRRAAAELDGEGLLLYQAAGEQMPPPTEAIEAAVLVRGVLGRWSAEQHLLEWREGRFYRSLSGTGFELATLLRVASSLRSEPGG